MSISRSAFKQIVLESIEDVSDALVDEEMLSVADLIIDRLVAEVPEVVDDDEDEDGED